MNVGSLFSGIGGLDLGLEQAGMSVRWQVENDRYCNRVLAHHWPDVPRYGDIKNVDTAALEPVDLICGGFPCQPFSVAGKRKGTADDRWLWPEYLRIVRGVKPRWVLVENVPGLLSMDSGRVFASILRDLAESGYDADWDCIPAAAFGAPHLRYRLFIVAHANGGRERNELPTRAYRGHPSRDESTQSSQAMAHAANVGRQRGGETRDGRIGFTDSGTISDSESQQRVRPNTGAGGHVPHTDSPGREEQRRPLSIFAEHAAIERSGWWEVESELRGIPDGLSAELDTNRVSRLKGLGNAVVPQVAEWIGRRILEVSDALEND